MESTNEILEEIKKNLIAEFAPEKIYLFGSHVWGTPDQDSDLDLLVIVSQSKLPPTKRASLAYRCRLSFRHYRKNSSRSRSICRYSCSLRASSIRAWKSDLWMRNQFYSKTS
jgi:predicted nucleotidyltransferase